MNKVTRSIQVLFVVLFFGVQSIMVAQTFKPLILKFGNSACDDGALSRDFFIDISFTTKAFNDDNEFIIELSDANGDFNSSTQVLTTLADATLNKKFDIEDVGFKLPPGTFGTNYRIRVRTTSPEIVPVSSTPFEAYSDIYKNHELILTDKDGNSEFTLCEGKSQELFINARGKRVDGNYSWYREKAGGDTFIATTTEPKLNITSPGKYYVIIDYGACGAPKSIYSLVSGISSDDSQIDETSPTVEICADESHPFKAKVNNPSYTYNWYLDGDLKQSSNSHEYTTPNAGQFGKYVLEIITGSGDCVTTSNEVELKPKTSASFSIVTETPGKFMFLPGEAKKLEITNVPSGATIQWYKDDIAILGQKGPVIYAVEPGVYFARVIKTSAALCPDIVDSEKTTLVAPTSFEVVISSGTTYTECESTSAKLTIVGIKAVGTDGNEYELSNEQITEDTPVLIEFQWYKDDLAVSGAIGDELLIASYLENGKYDLEVSSSHRKHIKGNTKDNTPSGSLDIKLIGSLPVVTSVPDSNSLCPGTGGITYTIDTLLPGYTYEWFKDGDTTPLATDVKDFVVDEIGEYVLKMSGLGCEKSLDPINVVLFDESVVIVTPSEKVVMNEGQTVTVTASGADAYVWYQGEGLSGTVLSTNETLDVDALGFYTVLATVGSCTVEKTIEVVEQDDLVIVPNAITPNGDGKNDYWQISNRYAFQPKVTIQMFNANGKEILNTTDYKNDWPTENIGKQRVFYYKIIREEKIIKAGTISVLH